MPKAVKSSAILPGGKLNNLLNNFSQNFIKFKSSKKIYLILLLVGLVLLVAYKKSWFIAAIVNDSPITNLELQIRLNQQFRDQTLNQMINEKIILKEAAKNNALPTEDEILRKISEIEQSVGGPKALNTLLTQQGQTRDSIKQQIKLQLSIEKLYSKDATVSAEEVDKFLETGRDQLRATDSASQVKEATELLKQQKLSQIFSQKFQELRQKANIKIF